MRRSSRTALLIFAAIPCAFFLYIGIGLEIQLGYDEYDQKNVLVKFLPWLILSSALSAPLWIPAIYKPRKPIIATVCRWTNIAILLALTYYFGRSLIYVLYRSHETNIVNASFTLIAICYFSGLLVILLESYKPTTEKQT